jgi:hypothetical protein
LVPCHAKAKPKSKVLSKDENNVKRPIDGFIPVMIWDFKIHEKEFDFVLMDDLHGIYLQLE